MNLKFMYLYVYRYNISMLKKNTVYIGDDIMHKKFILSLKLNLL